jgi:hypothetical protein
MEGIGTSRFLLQASKISDLGCALVSRKVETCGSGGSVVEQKGKGVSVELFQVWSFRHSPPCGICSMRQIPYHQVLLSSSAVHIGSSADIMLRRRGSVEADFVNDARVHENLSSELALFPHSPCIKSIQPWFVEGR